MRDRQHVVEALQFTIGIDPYSAQRVADERGGRGDVQLVVRTAGPGWLRVELVSGEPKRGSRLFIPGRGLFAVTRRDELRAGNGAPRVLLMLRTAPEGLPAVAV